MFFDLDKKAKRKEREKQQEEGRRLSYLHVHRDKNSDANNTELLSTKEEEVNSKRRKTEGESVKEPERWQIPQLISNWKNTKGYTIPLEDRITVSDNEFTGGFSCGFFNS